MADDAAVLLYIFDHAARRVGTASQNGRYQYYRCENKGALRDHFEVPVRVGLATLKHDAKSDARLSLDCSIPKIRKSAGSAERLEGFKNVVELDDSPTVQFRLFDQLVDHRTAKSA
jgi:hypothetical protein